MAEEDEVDAPLVFQCKSCSIIIGDSWSMQSSDAEMETITLSAAANVSRADEAVTSKQGADVGSTFHLLHCGKCAAHLGKVYLTTARAFDALRDMYTFSTDAVTSYKLGGGEPALGADGSAAGGGGVAAVQVELAEAVDNVEKLQNLVLVLDERIAKLEEGRAEHGGGKRRR
jgi:hypothetical protein